MSNTDTAQWTFNASPQASSEACVAAEAWAVAANLPKAVTMNLVLLIEELFTNTNKYGYGGKPGPVRIALSRTAGTAELSYADQAGPFDSSAPVEHWEPDLVTGRVGGIGLRLIQTKGWDI